MIHLPQIRQPAPQPLTAQALSAYEQEMDLIFPASFSQFLTGIGPGLYCDVVTTYHPQTIRTLLPLSRDAWNHFFWENPEVLSEAELLLCVPLGTTLDGDEIVFYPARPETFYLLPRQLHTIYTFPDNYLQLLHWIVYGGVLYESPTESPYVSGF